MDKRVLDLYLNNLHLKLHRGFLCICDGEQNEETKIPLDDILCITASGFGLTFSKPLLATLGSKNIPLVICDNTYHSTAILLPTFGYHKRTSRIKEQISICSPLKKRLWQSIIKQKITNQAKTLDLCDKDSKRLYYLVKKVKSGDSQNIEALAAKIYWKKLFGEDFIRDFTEPGINTFLNFGYGIIRSIIARYTIGSGLCPSLGLHHRNMFNDLCLCDDLIEPYRPMVDYLVYQMNSQNCLQDLTVKEKKELASLLKKEVKINSHQTKLRNAIQESVLSLVKSYQKKENLLTFPK